MVAAIAPIASWRKGEPFMSKSSDVDVAAMKKAIVDMANWISNKFDQDNPEEYVRYVKALVDGADVAFAVWQDNAEPDGVGMMMIKGNRALLRLNGSSMGKTAGIACKSRAHAIALQDALGEPDGTN
jgi:hypothetical protein